MKRKYINGKLDYRIELEAKLGITIDSRHPIHHHNKTEFVVCEDAAYHQIIERRTRALLECGKVEFRKCPYCKKYDDPKNMSRDKKNRYRHKECHAAYEHKRRTA